MIWRPPWLGACIMSRNTHKISKNYIKKEIYKNYELFKKQKTISIAVYLKTFDASIFQQKEYRKIKYDYPSMIKLILYLKLKGIKFQTKLVRYLKRHPGDKYKLGFNITPDQTTISYFINHILDSETKDLLDFTVKEIIEICEKFSIPLDIKTLKSMKPKTDKTADNQEEIKDKKTREICKLVKKRFTPFLDLNLGKTSKYSNNEFIDLLIFLGLNQHFAESGRKMYLEDRLRCPDPDTLLYHLKKYENIREIQRLYEILFEIVWQMAKQANMFDVRKRVDVAIDYHEWFFYGNRKTRMVVGKMPERGTNSCYKFATINIVENGKRFTLLTLPVSSLTQKEDVLTRLILFAKKHIRINHALLDRGFFDSKSIGVLNSYGVRWLIPGQRNYSIRRVMDLSPSPSVVTGFKMKNAVFNLVIADWKGMKRVFATNMNFCNNDVDLMEFLFILYSKRWGIETSYRVKKHSFRARTCSKNYHVRLFYFLFSVLLYNLWILADVLIWLFLFGHVDNFHLITAKYFGTLLIPIDPGG
jgi:putative transposase